MSEDEFQYEKGQRVFEGHRTQELISKKEGSTDVSWQELTELERAYWAAQEEAEPLYGIADALLHTNELLERILNAME